MAGTNISIGLGKDLEMELCFRVRDRDLGNGSPRCPTCVSIPTNNLKTWVSILGLL